MKTTMIKRMSCGALSAAAMVAMTSTAHARPPYQSLIPNAQGCATCHVSPQGGRPLNSFGQAFEAANLTWSPALANADADGDGWTNGQELGDPLGRWTQGQQPALPYQASPSSAQNKPADRDLCASPGWTACASDATCSDMYNGSGRYDCACRPGYQGDGFTCADINECSPPNPNPCDADAVCTNTPGSFTCACRPGFRGDGITCADIDECADGTAMCGANSTCVNQIGAPHECVCDSGFVRDAQGACVMPMMDMGMMDMGMMDMGMMDMGMAQPDMNGMPDMAAPDMSAPDMAAPDMAAPDMSPPADMGRADMSPPADMTPTNDMASGADMRGGAAVVTGGEGCECASVGHAAPTEGSPRLALWALLGLLGLRARRARRARRT